MTKEKVTKSPSGRPTRQPVGFRNRLQVRNQDPNYVYRWVDSTIDDGDRVAAFEELGYEKVRKGTHLIGNGRVTEPSPDGSVETISGGGGKKLILMRQRREDYEADQASKQKIVADREAAQKRIPDGFYGKITTETATPQ